MIFFWSDLKKNLLDLKLCSKNPDTEIQISLFCCVAGFRLWGKSMMAGNQLHYLLSFYESKVKRWCCMISPHSVTEDKWGDNDGRPAAWAPHLVIRTLPEALWTTIYWGRGRIRATAWIWACVNQLLLKVHKIHLNPLVFITQILRGKKVKIVNCRCLKSLNFSEKRWFH